MSFKSILALCGVLLCCIASMVFASPQELYKEYCAQCHEAGILKAPSLPEVASRAQERGVDILRKSVLEGRKRMPKKGGCFSCAEEQLLEIVDWMVMTGSSDIEY